MASVEQLVELPFSLFPAVLAALPCPWPALCPPALYLPPPSCCRVEHALMHAKHHGHEAMHAEMVLILIATLVVAQLLLVQWKQRHPRSSNVSVSLRFNVVL